MLGNAGATNAQVNQLMRQSNLDSAKNINNKKLIQGQKSNAIKSTSKAERL